MNTTSLLFLVFFLLGCQRHQEKILDTHKMEGIFSGFLGTPAEPISNCTGIKIVLKKYDKKIVDKISANKTALELGQMFCDSFSQSCKECEALRFIYEEEK